MSRFFKNVTKGKKLKSFLAVCFATLLSFSVTACGPDSNTPGNSDGETTVRDSLRECEVKILLGSEQIPNAYQYVLSQINKELAKDGKPYTVKFEFTAINGYMVNLESKVKENYDGAWAHRSFFSNLIGKDMIKKNLAPYMEKWGEKILSGSEIRFNSVTDIGNGNVYAIPANVPTANGTEIMLLRKDWMDKVGVSQVKSLSDFDNYLAKINADKDIAYTVEGGVEQKKAGFYAYTPDNYNMFLIREYCPDYFFPIVNNGKMPVYVVEENGKYVAKSFYQSQAFIDVIEKARGYVDAGYVNLSQNLNSESLFNRGYTGAISDYSVLKMSERVEKFHESSPNGALYDFLIQDSDNKKILYNTAGDSIVALKNGENTEELVDFINWMKDADNYKLVCYGVEGRNYYVNNGRYTFTNPDTKEVIPSDKQYLKYMPYWAIQDIRYMMFSENLSNEYIESVKTWENDAVISPLSKFMLKETNELIIARTKVLSSDEVVNNLMMGLEKYDRVIDSATGQTVYAKLIADINKNNGINDLISEIQRQGEHFKRSHRLRLMKNALLVF